MAQNDRDIDFVIRAQDLSKQALADTLSSVTKLTTAIQQQNLASKAGEGSSQTLTRSLKDLEAASASLIKAKLQIADLQERENLLSERAAKVADVQARLAQAQATPISEDKTTAGVQTRALKSLQTELNSAERLLARANAGYDTSVSKLEKLGIAAVDTAKATSILNDALAHVDRSLASGRSTEASFSANLQYVKTFTALLDAQEKKVIELAAVEEREDAARAVRLERAATAEAKSRTEDQQAARRAGATAAFTPLLDRLDAEDAARKVNAAKQQESLQYEERTLAERVKANAAAEQEITKRIEKETAEREAVKRADYIKDITRLLDQQEAEQRALDAVEKVRARTLAAQQATASGGQATPVGLAARTEVDAALGSTGSRKGNLLTDEVNTGAEAVDKLSASFKTGSLNLSTYSRQLDEIANAAAKLRTDANLLDTFQRQTAAVAAADAAFREAASDVLRLSQAYKAGAASAEELSEAEGRLGRTASSGASGDLQRQLTLLAQIRAQLKGRGLDEANVTAEINKTTVAAEKLTRLQNQQKPSGEGLFGLKQFQFQNLGFQINDVITQLSLGQGVLRTFESQAGQIFQIFDVPIGKIIAFLPVIAVAAAGIYTLVSAFSRLTDQNASIRQFNGQLTATNQALTENATALVKQQLAIERLGVSYSDAGNLITEFLTKGLNTGALTAIAKAAQDVTELFGGDFKKNVTEITSAFTHGFDAVANYNKQLNFLKADELERIKDLFDAGKAEEARTLALNLFIAKQDEGAAKNRSSWTVATRELSNAWKEFLDTIAHSDIAVGVVGILTRAVKGLALEIKLLTGQIDYAGFQARREAAKNDKPFDEGADAARVQRDAVAKVQQERDYLGSKRDELLKSLNGAEPVGPNKERLAGYDARLKELDDKLRVAKETLATLEAQLGPSGESLPALEAQRRIVQQRLNDLTTGGTTAPGGPGSGRLAPADYEKNRDATARAYGLDPEYVRRVQLGEGERDKDGSFKTSSANAVGGFQVTPGTFAELQKKYPQLIQGKITDDSANTTAGILKLRDRLALGQSPREAYFDYHDGENRKGVGPSAIAAYDGTTRPDGKFKPGIGTGYEGTGLAPSGVSPVAAATAELARLNAAIDANRKAQGLATTEVQLANKESDAYKNANNAAADSLERENNLFKDRNASLAERAAADARRVDEVRRTAVNAASAGGANPQDPRVAAAIDEKVELERKRLAELREKTIKAEYDRRIAAEREFRRALTSAQNEADKDDGTNAERQRKAIQEKADETARGLREKAAAAGVSSVDGVSIDDKIAQLQAVTKELQDQATIKADQAAATKILSERADAYKKIQSDFKEGLISAGEAFKRTVEVSQSFADRIKDAVAKARADLAGQAGPNPSAKFQQADASLANIKPEGDGKEERSTLDEGFKQLRTLEETRKQVVSAQNELLKEGLTTPAARSQAIQDVYAETGKQYEKLNGDLSQNLDYLKSVGKVSEVEYGKYTAQLKKAGQETNYVSDEQKALIKTIETSFTQRASAAITQVAGTFANFLAGTAKAKDVFASIGSAFASLTAGVLQDIAQMILKTLLLKAIQAGLNLVTGGTTGAATAAVGAVAGSGGGTVTTGGANVPTVTTQVQHSGGISGGSGVFRQIDAAVFNNARRFHSGGMAGLAADEVPTILQTGEQVLSRSQVRQSQSNSGGGGGGQNIRNVLVVGDGDVSAAMAGSHGEKVVLNHLKRNLPTIRSWVGT